MSLARAEWRRFFKRRFTRWMLVFVVLVLGAVVAGITATNHAPDAQALARAEAQAQQQYEQQLRSVEEQIEQCERVRADGRGDGEDRAGDRWPADCAQLRQMVVPPEEMASSYLPPTFDFRAEFEELLVVFTGVLALFAFVAGASFVGAEWRSGGMTNLLLWRPRRLRVLGAKLTTMLVAVSAVTVLVGAAWTAALWQVATHRGITDTMTAGAWQSFALTGVRGWALVLAAAAVGFAVASLGRHTAAALGTAIAAFVVGVIGMSVVAQVAGLPYPQAWMWVSYVEAWMRKSVTFRDFDGCEQALLSGGPCEPATLEVTWQVAGAGMGAVVTLLVLAALWHMRRRDVT